MTPQPEALAAAPEHPFQPHSDPGGDPLMELIGAAPSQDAPGIVPFAPAGDFVSHFGLRENPFADCVHPAFFFRTDGHSEAYRSMMLAVDFRASLGMVTGPSGTGKTLVSQLLLQHFDESKHRVVLVLVTPGLSKTGLLR